MSYCEDGKDDDFESIVRHAEKSDVREDYIRCCWETDLSDIVGEEGVDHDEGTEDGVWNSIDDVVDLLM